MVTCFVLYYNCNNVYSYSYKVCTCVVCYISVVVTQCFMVCRYVFMITHKHILYLHSYVFQLIVGLDNIDIICNSQSVHFHY